MNALIPQPDNQNTERMVSITITIRIERVPISESGRIEEEAFRVGDEYGARVDVVKSPPRVDQSQV